MSESANDDGDLVLDVRRYDTLTLDVVAAYTALVVAVLALGLATHAAKQSQRATTKAVRQSAGGVQ